MRECFPGVCRIGIRPTCFREKKEKILALYPDYPANHAFQEIAKEIFYHVGILRAAECLAERGGNVYVYYITYTTPMLR